MGPSGRFTHVMLYWTIWERFIQVLYLGRAPRTKETLPDLREKCQVTKHSRVFHGLTASKRTPRFWASHRELGLAIAHFPVLVMIHWNCIVTQQAWALRKALRYDQGEPLMGRMRSRHGRPARQTCRSALGVRQRTRAWPGQEWVAIQQLYRG